MDRQPHKIPITIVKQAGSHSFDDWGIQILTFRKSVGRVLDSGGARIERIGVLPTIGETSLSFGDAPARKRS